MFDGVVSVEVAVVPDAEIRPPLPCLHQRLAAPLLEKAPQKSASVDDTLVLPPTVLNSTETKAQ